MSETLVRDHIAVYECQCGTKFTSQDAMREHAQDCEGMPHIGD